MLGIVAFLFLMGLAGTMVMGFRARTLKRHGRPFRAAFAGMILLAVITVAALLYLIAGIWLLWAAMNS